MFIVLTILNVSPFLFFFFNDTATTEIYTLSLHDALPISVYAKRDATANLRYKFGEDLKSEDPQAAILVEDLKGFGLPGMGLGVRLLLATADRFFVYPTKLREYQARYRGSFLHGGVTPEEVILPVALLTPRRAGTAPVAKGGAR